MHTTAFVFACVYFTGVARSVHNQGEALLESVDEDPKALTNLASFLLALNPSAAMRRADVSRTASPVLFRVAKEAGDAYLEWLRDAGDGFFWSEVPGLSDYGDYLYENGLLSNIEYHANDSHPTASRDKLVTLPPLFIVPPEPTQLPQVFAEEKQVEASTSGEEVGANITAVEAPPAAVEARPAAVEAPPRFMSKAWFAKWMEFDKDQIKRLGVDAFFTYGVVSNFNVALTTAFAWAVASSTTGLSPLVPGQWKNFVKVYVGLYISLGSILRPFRMALAVAMTPVYGNIVIRFRDRLPFRTSNPKLNRTLAIIAITLLLNVFGTVSLAGLGAYIAGLVTGVPAFPPGWRISRVAWGWILLLC